MGMDDEGETCDGKKGKELFLELLRRLPSAQVEDYYLNGVWKDEDIQLDYELLEAHRMEAGAEDPPTLEELAHQEPGIPPLPDDKPAWGAPGYQRPGAPAAYGSVGPGAMPANVTRVSAAILGRSAAMSAASLRPQPPKSAPTSAMISAAGSGAAGSGPSAELRQIALFIAKWKLEATKTKLLLARLTPPRRRWVMSNFSQAASGLSSTAQLESYIGKCERENSWASVDSASPAGASRPMSGLKRPLTSAPAFDPNKRAKVGGYAPAPRVGMAGSAIRPGISSTYARTTPAWLGGAGSVNRMAPAAARPPFLPQRATYGGVGYAPAGRPGIPKPAGITAYQRPGYQPAAPKYGGGTIKPAVPKPKGGGGGGKPGSLIANLLRM